jgi:hypothetical protein
MVRRENQQLPPFAANPIGGIKQLLLARDCQAVNELYPSVIDQVFGDCPHPGCRSYQGA